MPAIHRVVDRAWPVFLMTIGVGCFFGGSQEPAASSAAPASDQLTGAPSLNTNQPGSGLAAGPVAGGHNSSEWGYEDLHGPRFWGSMSPEFGTCSSGNRQSPIDLSGARDRDFSSIEYSYRPTTLSIVNTGRTVRVDHFGDSFITLGRWPYRLRQFHFHSPSEHTVGGARAEIEMHLVHMDERGRLVVIGVLIEEGEYNPGFEGVWQNLPRRQGDPRIIGDVSVDSGSLLPSDRTFYHYTGSLTTPPCTEGVRWFVMSSPVAMSREQIAQFKQIVDGNNRPVQDRYGRAVYLNR